MGAGPTNVCDLGADLGQPVARTFVRGVEDVRAQQGLESGADGDEKELGVVVAHEGHGAGRQLAERSLHGQDPGGEDLGVHS